MPVLFSNDKPKVNFQLVTFKYSDMGELDQSNRHSRKYNLEIPFNTPEIQSMVNALYYVNLGTGYLPGADFSLAFWYADEAITSVEAAILTIKKRNPNTILNVLNVVRGRMHELSQDDLYPDNELGQTQSPTIITPDVLKNLNADRQAKAFMMKSYLVSLDLNFSSDWKGLSKDKRTTMLKGLLGHADKLFPGLVNTVLVETPMSSSPLTLTIYADHYSDIQSFMGTVSSLPIYGYLEDTNKAIICNHTSCATLEYPREKVIRR